MTPTGIHFAPDPRAWLADRLVPNGDCLEFTGTKGRDGYGLLRRRGKRVRAHRFAYELAYGPIPDGLHICHTCDNPPCCNPEHLFAGTAKDNMGDMARKGRHYSRIKPHLVPKGERSGNAKLTDEAVAIIRAVPPFFGRTAALACRFGVKACTVDKVLRGDMWSHVTATPDPERLLAELEQLPQFFGKRYAAESLKAEQQKLKSECLARLGKRAA